MGLAPERHGGLGPVGISAASSTEAAAQLLASQLVAQAHAAAGHPHVGMSLLSAACNGLQPGAAAHGAPAALAAAQACGAAEGGARALDRLARGEGVHAACVAAQALVSSSARQA